METALLVAQIVETLLPTLAGLATSAIAAAQTNDQAALDALFAKANAAADALAPKS